MLKRLSSRHHPLVALCRQLARHRAPGDTRLLLDGLHLVGDARRAGLAVETAAFSARALATPEGAGLAAALESTGAEILAVSDALMAALSPLSAPSGVVAIATRPAASLDQVFEGAPSLVVVAVGVQDPGNVGAIIRAAEAGAATGAAFCGESADPFGWKALRGSMGSAFRLPLAPPGVALDEVLAAARAAAVRVVATLPRGGRPVATADLSGPVALLIGGEGPGLPAAALTGADDRVSIPMKAPVESLNVAVAAALLIYEAGRQRQRPPHGD